MEISTETCSFLINTLSWYFLKKIAVILLMCMLLFNWFGYQILTHYLQQHADNELETRLDKEEYDTKDLVTIKIPLHLPYITDRIEYTRCDGEIDLNGTHYKYVKRRVYRDSLELLCLVDQSKQKLTDAGNRYFSLVNGLQSSHDQSKESPSFFKTLLTEYQPELNDWNITSCYPQKQNPVPRVLVYTYPCSSSGPDQPPEGVNC